MSVNLQSSSLPHLHLIFAMFLSVMVLRDSRVEALGPFNTLLNFRERHTRTPPTTTEQPTPTTSVRYTAVGGPSPTRPFKLIATSSPIPTPPFKVVSQPGSRPAFLRLQNLRGLMASSHGNRVRHYFQMSKAPGKRSVMTDIPPWVKWVMALKAQERSTRSREIAPSETIIGEEDARTIREIRALERASMGTDQTPRNHHVACFFNPVSCFGQAAFREREPN
ncbi:hypothetical protein RvY_04380 [Ramazzottius varieornatus]|uniref:Uncharacterized protein n=1 Tax=Ramazzottius varieornatus TaxID=947166 RepID=A0A1D1UUU2_RAMVA|nr:hypothetical protein RvY_04380 [Ramazzottius varieornatus]